MGRIYRLASRNLLRYGRRTLLTSGLIVLGIVAVLLFVSVSGSFKQLIIGQITDSMLGHIQVHKRGYVASIDNLPLNLNLAPEGVAKIEAALAGIPEVVASSQRVKFGAMFSNFTETTSIRLNGVDPQRELAAMPAFAGRLVQGQVGPGFLGRGKVLIPEILARGMKVKAGDSVVLVATNLDGSVNGRNFIVEGVLGDVTGPGGRDGYINIEDARDLLRLAQPEVTEIAIRLKGLSGLEQTRARIERAIAGEVNPKGMPALEVHTWESLTPFANIARMIDLMDLFIRIMLVGIVLISVMNVMVMAVYERIREIGTIAAIGTPPGRILALFLTEGLLLALVGTVVGTLLSVIVIQALNIWPLTIRFSRQVIQLSPSLALSDVLSISGVVLVVAVLASLQPAWKASRMDPITALRHV